MTSLSPAANLIRTSYAGFATSTKPAEVASLNARPSTTPTTFDAVSGDKSVSLPGKPENPWYTENNKLSFVTPKPAGLGATSASRTTGTHPSGPIAQPRTLNKDPLPPPAKNPSGMSPNYYPIAVQEFPWDALDEYMPGVTLRGNVETMIDMATSADDRGFTYKYYPDEKIGYLKISNFHQGFGPYEGLQYFPKYYAIMASPRYELPPGSLYGAPGNTFANMVIRYNPFYVKHPALDYYAGPDTSWRCIGVAENLTITGAPDNNLYITIVQNNNINQLTLSKYKDLTDFLADPANKYNGVDKYDYDAGTGLLTVKGDMNQKQRDALLSIFTDPADQTAISVLFTSLNPSMFYFTAVPYDGDFATASPVPIGAPGDELVVDPHFPTTRITVTEGDTPVAVPVELWGLPWATHHTDIYLDGHILNTQTTGTPMVSINPAYTGYHFMETAYLGVTTFGIPLTDNQNSVPVNLTVDPTGDMVVDAYDGALTESANSPVPDITSTIGVIDPSDVEVEVIDPSTQPPTVIWSGVGETTEAYEYKSMMWNLKYANGEPYGFNGNNPTNSFGQKIPNKPYDIVWKVTKKDPGEGAGVAQAKGSPVTYTIHKGVDGREHRVGAPVVMTHKETGYWGFGNSNEAEWDQLSRMYFYAPYIMWRTSEIGYDRNGIEFNVSPNHPYMIYLTKKDVRLYDYILNFVIPNRRISDLILGPHGSGNRWLSRGVVEDLPEGAPTRHTPESSIYGPRSNADNADGLKWRRIADARGVAVFRTALGWCCEGQNPLGVESDSLPKDNNVGDDYLGAIAIAAGTDTAADNYRLNILKSFAHSYRGSVHIRPLASVANWTTALQISGDGSGGFSPITPHANIIQCITRAHDGTSFWAKKRYSLASTSTGFMHQHYANPILALNWDAYIEAENCPANQWPYTNWPF